MQGPDATPELPGAQPQLERLNQLYAMLSRINRTIVRCEDPHELYATACRIAVEQGGFALAWIGLVEPASRCMVPVAHAGAAIELEALRLAGAADLGPSALAIHDDAPCIVNEAGDRRLQPWHALLDNGLLQAVAAYPLHLEGRVIGAFTVSAAEAGFFDAAEVRLLAEVADDLSFALEVLRREERRLATESKMRYLAFYDSETGLPGRNLFEERLSEAGASFAVLVANLRRYHGILQLLGQAAGQEIARIVAGRLEATLPAVPVARISESEFAFVLTPQREPVELEEIAWRLHAALAEAVRIEAREVFLDPVIGIARAPGDGTAPEVLRSALLAAAMIPADSSSFCRFFVADMDRGSRHRLDLEAALRRALEGDEFVLHYQPQVDLASGRVVGVEALLRWQRPDFGLVSPLDFIPLLEDTGLIGGVGEWVMHEACRRARHWQDAGLPPIRMAVNLSARQYHDGDIRALVRRALSASRLDPEWLELELTEGVVLLNADGVIRTMRDLQADGVSHALDDFGTGYSSLSYLQRLPVARIKIDRAFVTNLTSSPNDAAIARAVVGMAHSLGLAVIAEGVETIGQLCFLRGLDCDEIQGYYFSRPLPADALAALLRQGRSIAPPDAAKAERVLLLVDDEPSILSALRRVLLREGYRILCTTDPHEGFELLAAHRVGVVVSDQRMQEMTGTEFLRRVKSLHPETIRIVLSGYTELNSVIDAVNRGAVYKFLTKPWDDETLRESLRDAFRLHEMGRDNRALTRRLAELEATRQ